MDEGGKTVSGGIGFCGLLTIVFITLKLLGVINWAWGWVLSPLLISTAIGVLIIIVYAIIVLVIHRINKRNQGGN